MYKITALSYDQRNYVFKYGIDPLSKYAGTLI